MNLFIILAVVTWSNAAKLDRAYLPPSYAQTSGGSGNFLQAPVTGSNDYKANPGFGAATRNFAQTGQEYTQDSGDFAQNAGNFNQDVNEFSQNGVRLQSTAGAQNGARLQSAAVAQNGFARNGARLQSAVGAQNGFAQNGADFQNPEVAQNGFTRNNEYSQNDNGNFNGFNNFGNVEARPERAQAAFERNAAILRQDTQNDGETYSYAYETENGIIAEENGVATNGVEAQGGYSYTGDDGQVYTVRYTAGVNGFVPEGDHLPTPPPIPEEILRALEQNSRDEAAGIYDDGSYNDYKYSGNDNQYNGNNYNNNNLNQNLNGNNYENNYNNANNLDNRNNYEEVTDDEDSIVTTNALFRSGTRPAARNQINNQAFAKQAAGFRNQGNENVPSFERQQNNLANGPRNQAYNQGSNDLEKAYLPPFEGNVQENSFNGQNQGLSNQRSGFVNPNAGVENQNARNGVTRAYLPPQNQRSQSFGRRQRGFARNSY